ncbi:uncharacterized protein LOC107031072 [Solanum pennellii]|uniref:Uncharacterized protein LOC107031072 n=1 Tax=Solanum pennellii TaxID=28526 RepID=A0ABM1HMQ1_SOLPN|nr:uncharacterized protein LOC107031072 [Solanum pennellii]
MSNIGQWNGLKTTINKGDGGLLHLHLPLNPSPSPLLFFTQKPISLNPLNPLSSHLLLQKQQQPLHICCSRPSSKWDSNAESIKNQSFSNLEDEEEELNEEEFLEQGAQFFAEYIESIWIFKVFCSYGFVLIPILIVLISTGGAKAFAMAFALPIGQSTLFFAIQKILDVIQNKPTRKSTSKKRQRAAPNSSKTDFWRRGGSSKTRKRKTGYQSWVSNNDVSASKDDREVSRYGGWDELDQEMQSSKSSDKSSAETAKIPVEKGKLSRPEATSDTPLLLRLLISMFPFLASWTKML